MAEFVRSANNIRVRHSHGKHTIDEIREGRDAVHEDPEMGEDFWARQDTTEYQCEGEK